MAPTGALSSATFLFDLDGTLIDSRRGIIRSFRHALTALDKACPSDDVLEGSIGKPFRQVLAGLIGSQDEDVIEQAVTIYRERYSKSGLYEASVYTGIPEMLRALDRMPLYIATSKASIYATRVVEHFGLSDHFRGVYGPDLNGQPGRKTELVAHVLRTESISGPAVMIGDRADDMLAAKANGAWAIGVTWGYGSERELADAGADALCRTPSDLWDMLRDPRQVTR